MRFGPLIIAVVLALAAGFIALKMMGSEEPPEQTAQMVQRPEPAPIETVNVYIASRYIAIGSVITPDMLTPQPWPKNLAVETFVTDPETADKLVGQIARASFQQGEPISATKVAAADQGSFLAGDLPKGMRAVTINTDETLGVAGFVFPGDKVDILMTHRVPKWDGLRDAATDEDITETLLSNISVLAVDQIANIKEIQANSQNNSGQPQDTSTIHVPRTVSLMVSPEDAHKLRLGEKVGQLSLALRSAQDRDTVDAATLTMVQNITQFPINSIVKPKQSATASNSNSPGQGTGDGVRVVRGIEVSEISPLEQKNSLPPTKNPLQLTALATSAALPSSTPANAANISAATAMPVQMGK